VVEITLIVLKFAALITGGIFAAIGLLTDYRDKNGVVTKWGRIALFGIVLSTIIGAGTQAIESYRDRDAGLKNDAANRKSEEQTQHLLAQVRRAIYPLRDIALHFVIAYPTDAPSFSNALKSRLGLPAASVSAVERGGPHYPKTGTLLQLFEPEVLIHVRKTGQDPATKRADLVIVLRVKEPIVTYFDGKLYVRIEYQSPPDNLVRLSPTIASIEDIDNCEIRMSFSVRELDDSNLTRADLDELLQRTRINGFRLYASNHQLFAELQPSGRSGEFVGKIVTGH
jgi:hypothetical protein